MLLSIHATGNPTLWCPNPRQLNGAAVFVTKLVEGGIALWISCTNWIKIKIKNNKTKCKCRCVWNKISRGGNCTALFWTILLILNWEMIINWVESIETIVIFNFHGWFGLTFFRTYMTASLHTGCHILFSLGVWSFTSFQAQIFCLFYHRSDALDHANNNSSLRIDQLCAIIRCGLVFSFSCIGLILLLAC